MKKLAALLALSTVLGLGTAAKAADVVEPLPACHDWRGPYIGAHGGYSWGDGNVDTAPDVDPNGWVFGPGGGWNFQHECFVFGIDADWGFGEVDDSEGTNDDFDIEPNGHVRGRVGYSMDGLLPFLAVGLAIADIDVRVIGEGGDSATHLGLSVGGGLDWAVADSITLRGEYLFDNYEWEEYDKGIGNVEAETHTVRGAIIWNFGTLF